MHTTVIHEAHDGPHGLVGDGDVRIHHNGDWSGEARLQWSEGGRCVEVDIPGWVAKRLVRNYDRRRP